MSALDTLRQGINTQLSEALAKRALADEQVNGLRNTLQGINVAVSAAKADIAEQEEDQNGSNDA